MNKRLEEIIETHGYNLKLEVGNGLTKVEARNIIENAVNEALTMHDVGSWLPVGTKVIFCGDERIIAKPDSILFEGCLVYYDSDDGDIIVYLEKYKKETKTAIIIPDYTGRVERIEVPLELLSIIGRQ